MRASTTSLDMRAELEEKIEYMRQNPIKKGLAIEPADYKWLFVAHPVPERL
jgi:hypothetical protein